jgi:hypothetical protein
LLSRQGGRIMGHRPGQATGALVLALVGGLLIAAWMVAITVIVIRSIG